MRDRLRQLFLQTLPDLDPAAALRRHVHRDGPVLHAGGAAIELPHVRTVHVVAFGKAARPMATALLPLLQGAQVRGLCVPPAPDAALLPPLEVIAGSHPVPDAGSLHAAERALVLLGNAGPEDLVLFLVSGGGSALLERPVVPGIALTDLQHVHRLLVGSGADIVAINTVRKHLSGVKGGRLALRAQQARQVTLFLSDVPPARPEMVASGPTWPDASTAGEAGAILDHLDLLPQLPATVRALVARGLPETPKPGHPAFAHARHVCLLDNDAALTHFAHRVADAGFAVERAPAGDDLPVEDAAEGLLRRLLALAAAHPGRPVAVLAGGELSVPLPAQHGTGGRNLQFALHCARRIEGQPIAVLSAGTDGIDGNAPAAGAVVDGTTSARARALGLDPTRALAAFDAHPLLHALGDALVTGPTGTNVRDLRILVHG